MILDYSQQIGKKITTHGYQKLCVQIDSIIYIQCHGGLSTVFLNDKSQIAEIKTLKEFEVTLFNMGFIRINRNTLINVKYINKITMHHGKRTIYLGEIMLTVSKRRLPFLKEQLL